MIFYCYCMGNNIITLRLRVILDFSAYFNIISSGFLCACRWFNVIANLYRCCAVVLHSCKHSVRSWYGSSTSFRMDWSSVLTFPSLLGS